MKCSFVTVLIATMLITPLCAAQENAVSWKIISGGIREVAQVCVDQTFEDMLYIAAGRHIFTYNIRSGKWHRLFSVSAGSTIRDITAADSGEIYAATDQGLYRSDESGARWRRIFSGGSPEQRHTRAIMIAEKAADMIKQDAKADRAAA